jgi:hypothetical protein
MFSRIALVTLALLASACAKIDGVPTDAAKPVANAHSMPRGTTGFAPRGLGRQGFASLPDHGDLVAYPRKVTRADGAYTWHRADLSEAHALRAIVDGHLRVTTPEGEILDFQYDRHVEHPSGDWTWIGHRPGHEGEQAILTFGDQAAFGSIAQSGKPPLRLTVRDGVSWLVETDPAKVAGIVNTATKPRRPDYHIVPKSELPGKHSSRPRAAADGAVTGPVAYGATAPALMTAAVSTVDLIIGYTPGFAATYGGASGALTRLNNLVDVANAAYANSKISARVRLVKVMQVNYTDDNSNDTALEQLSGYKSGTGPVTPNAAFDGLRAAREQYGADLVSLVRDYRDPVQGGCGIAWLLGGGLQGIGAGEGWAELGYSVVSDRTPQGPGSYYCLDESLAHELGHNMGAAHDKATAKGDDGALDNPDDYGAYTYSFGYKTTATTGNFHTIMAYGDTGQTIYRTFSTPLTTFCGGRVCGSSSEDNARTLSNTIPVVAAFRIATSVNGSRVHNDFNGDGLSDLFWRHSATGANTIWNSAGFWSQQAVATVSDMSWKIVGSGDFDGDGQVDVLWRNHRKGTNAIWMSANSATQQRMETVVDLSWNVAGIGDFNGDGRADVLWRNVITGENAIWKSANEADQQPISGVNSQLWLIVGVGDFDADGRSDILWRNKGNGRNTIWKGANPGTQITMTAVTDQDWIVAGIGDFNGDSRSDILWHNNKTGASVIWESASYDTQKTVKRLTSADWKISAVGDYNGDGESDIFWRNSISGANVIWSSGNYATQQAVKAVSDLRWTTQG